MTIDDPYKEFRKTWSISIYKGCSPFDMKPFTEKTPPHITREDITDIPASFVADPFLLKVENMWYLFMEVMNANTNQGEIALSTSVNLVNWDYQKVILKEEFHLSYPYVFEWRGSFYMLPETLTPATIRLYKSSKFPYEWEHVVDLLSGKFADPSILRHGNKWWLFACIANGGHDTLNLYYAADLAGPYTPHPINPLIDSDNTKARPGGRLIRYQDKLLRFAQDCYPEYGKAVRAFEIEYLTTTDYQETEVAQSPVYGATGKGWNSDGMHHIDARRIGTGEWIAAVDGYCLDFTAY